MQIGDTVTRTDSTGRTQEFYIFSQKELEYHRALADTYEYEVRPRVHDSGIECESCSA